MMRTIRTLEKLQFLTSPFSGGDQHDQGDQDSRKATIFHFPFSEGDQHDQDVQEA